MRKIILLFALTLAVLSLTGCMNETFSAPYGATAIADMPPSPEGLVLPIPEGYDVIDAQESETLFAYGYRSIFIRYAIAPNASSIINSAIAGDLNAFARQYAPSNVHEILEISTFSFIGQNAFIVIATLTENYGHGHASETAAVYAVAPFGDFFVMVSGYAPVLERDAIRADVLAFMGDFTVGSPEPDDVECDEQPEGRV